jgi:hypothetical protein
MASWHPGHQELDEGWGLNTFRIETVHEIVRQRSAFDAIDGIPCESLTPCLPLHRKKEFLGFECG